MRYLSKSCVAQQLWFHHMCRTATHSMTRVRNFWRTFSFRKIRNFSVDIFCTLKISKNFLYETSHFEYWFRRFRTWWHRKVSWLVKAINWPCFWPSIAHTIWLIQKWALMVRNTFWPRAYTPWVYRTCLEIF